ncbi:hypothetical protein [Arthrobacter castelli]|uniref:hypothetical protein n=1 Tax=Arthrobacter castelli TaxID=271431 RepID=UPI0003F6FCBC|nr:hypothetical protein [Arthrobacter castelli]
MTEHQADRATDPQAGQEHEPASDAPAAGPEHWHPEHVDAGDRPQAYAGPFTRRDVFVMGSVALMLIGSLVPFSIGPDYYTNLWNSSSLFFLGLGIVLPLVVAGLFMARRVTGSHPRIGSLSVDQFGSVIALFAAAYFFIVTASAFGLAPLLALIGALALVASTTLAPHLPVFSGDFAGRSEAPAHLMARASATPAPKPPKPEYPDNGQRPDEAGYGQYAAAQEPGSFGAGSIGRGFGGGHAVDQGDEPDRRAEAGDGSYDYSYQSRDGGEDDYLGGYPDQDSGSDTGSAYPERNEAWADPAPSDAGPDDSGRNESGQGQWSSTGTAAFPAVGYDSESTGAAQHGRGTTQHGRADSFGATRETYYDEHDDEYGEEEAYDAFWFAVGQPREIVDENTGAAEFVIEPGAWVLALQDRGDEFLVQHTDGRVGVLRDLSNIERA